MRGYFIGLGWGLAYLFGGVIVLIGLACAGLVLRILLFVLFAMVRAVFTWG